MNPTRALLASRKTSRKQIPDQVCTNHRILIAGVLETQDITEFSSLNWLNLWINLVHKQHLLCSSRCLFEEAEFQNFHIVVCFNNINTIIMAFKTSWHSYWNLTYVKRLHLKVHNQFWETATIQRTCRKMRCHIKIPRFSGCKTMHIVSLFSPVWRCVY